MTKAAEPQQDPVIIKKYANRRLYNTDSSSYVTLEDLATMVRSERDFVVFDAKTGEDLTHGILTQIIVDEESKGQNLLPIRFLRQLIRFYGNSIEQLVPSYLEFSLDSLTRDQERYRKQFSNPFGAGAFEAMQEQARQNIAMFEKAMGAFSPFAAGEEDGEQAAAGIEPCAPSEASDARRQASHTEEIAALKAQLSDMQEKLDQLSRRSG